VKLQRKYDLQDRKERNMTGSGGEFCENYDLLGQMQEEKESLDAKNVCSAMDFICDPWGYYGWEVHLL
jgi:hypothetical protein